MQLTSLLIIKGIANDVVKNLYTGMKNTFSDPKDQLSWVSGIVQIFKDQEWTRQEYESLSSTFTGGVEAKRLKANKASNLERAFW